MSVPHKILVQDLGKLTSERVRSLGTIFLQDPENLTPAHVESLRALINRLDYSPPLDLAALDEKLSHLPPLAPAPASPPASRRSWSDRGTTPDLDVEEERRSIERQEREAYDALILDGGWPSHHPDRRFGLSEQPGDCPNIVTYWETEWFRGKGILQPQWHRWRDFRKLQFEIRQGNTSPERFERFVNYIRTYRREKGLQGDICLLPNPKEQSRVDDWKEFQFQGYRKADRLEREIEQALKGMRDCESRLDAAIVAGQPVDEIEWMREDGFVMERARKGTAERNLQRHAVFLEWIAEQLPIIASESGSDSHLTSRGNQPSDSDSAHLGKRKRSLETTVETPAKHQKLSDSHERASRVSENVNNEPQSPVSPATRSNNRDPRPLNVPQTSRARPQPRRSERSAANTQKANVPKLVATSPRPGGILQHKGKRAARQAKTRPRISGASRRNAAPPHSEGASIPAGLRRSPRILKKREKLPPFPSPYSIP